MSRHRNVRSMNYTDEYDGYDDIYGHSVEDDYSISPSDAAEFMYDRTRQPQMSAFFNEDEDIVEEDETGGEEKAQRRDSANFKWPRLSDLDEARLRSCLEEIRNVVGDSVPEHVLVESALKCDFDVHRALDHALEYSQAAATGPSPDAIDGPKPQRQRRERNRDRGDYEGIDSNGKLLRVIALPVRPGKRFLGIPTSIRAVECAGGAQSRGGVCGKQDEGDASGTQRETGDEVEAQGEKKAASAVRVVAPNPDVATIKGFDVHAEGGDSRKQLSATPSPRSQSPLSDKEVESAVADTLDKKSSVAKEEGKSSPRPAASKVDVIAQYQKERGQSKDQLHMVVIGHVDAGKSTLMGHLLFALGQVNKKTMHKYEQESKKLGKQSFLYAWILDETGEERSRGITMDVGQSKFETASKLVTLLDAPGHKDFIPNMITGATQADVALMVVDATRGEFETGFESGGQTREHALLVRSLGVSQLCVAVNKLDTVDWSEDRFREIVQKLGNFLRQAGFRESDVTFVPCSGLTGQNLTSAPTENQLVRWYQGPCLLQVIDQFRSPERPIRKPLRLSVNDIFKGQGSGFCVSGRVETGALQVGERVLVQPQGEAAIIKALTIDEAPSQVAFAGDQVNATLAGVEMQNVSVGDILCDPAHPVPVTSHFEARIVVFNITVPITKGYSVVLHHQSLVEPAVIVKLVAQLHRGSGEVVKRRPRCLGKNSSAVVQLTTTRPICMELYRDVKELGRFMLRVAGVTVAAGLATKWVNKRLFGKTSGAHVT